MKTAIKILRVLLIVILVVTIGIPVAFYLLLSTDWAQRRLGQAGEQALEKLLGTEVTIEKVNFWPFNKIEIQNVEVLDDNGAMAAVLNSVEARFELLDFLIDEKIIIDYVVIDGLQASIYKENPQSPLNIAQIIERLNKPKPEKEPSTFQLSLNNVEILNSQLAYNVLSEPATPGHFNANHLLVSDLNCQVFVPSLANDTYDVHLMSFSAQESSGLTLSNMRAKLLLSPQESRIDDLVIRMPGSKLMFAPIVVEGDWKENLTKAFVKIPLEIGIMPESKIELSDLTAFVPAFAQLNQDIKLQLDAYGRLDSLDIRKLNINVADKQIQADIATQIISVVNPEQMVLKGLKAQIMGNNGYIAHTLNDIGVQLKPAIKNVLGICTNPRIDLNYDGSLHKGAGILKLKSDAGRIDVKATFAQENNNWQLQGDLDFDELKIGQLANSPQLGLSSGKIKVDGTIGKCMQGDVEANIDLLQFKDYDYHDVVVQLNAQQGNAQQATYEGKLVSNDENARLSLSLLLKRDSLYAFDLVSKIYALNPEALNLYKKFPDNVLSGTLMANGEGRSVAWGCCDIDLKNINYLDANGEGLTINTIEIDADNRGRFDAIDIKSDFLQGSVQGEYNLATLTKSFNVVLGEVFPSYAEITQQRRIDQDGNFINFGNDFIFDFTIQDAEDLCQFFNLPVTIMDPVSITGNMCDKRQKFILSVDAPWLIQGSNLVENTNVDLLLDGLNQKGTVYASTHYPTKKGPMDLVTTVNAVNDRLATNVDWQIVRDNPINGNFNFDTSIFKNSEQKLCVEVDFRPGLINFGNEVWKIRPSQIVYSDKYLQVSKFALEAPTQSVTIDGTASQYPQDYLTVKLKGIQLLDIFETLNIDNALICGNATGTLKVSEIFTPTPNIESTSFFVKDMGYNGCVLGDGNIKINYDVEQAAFCFDALLDQAEGRQSKIKGSIVPAEEYLDFDFDADHVKVGFLKPFMAAFCSDIEGYASGHARLYGTFKDIDLEGDINADTVRLKIDFTNTWYSASDSLRIRPGMIDLDHITIYDELGNTAMLNGYVKHYYFHRPEFDFAITGAKNFLSYNITKADNPRWYGTIYGNGSAHVTGYPGVVNIGVAMSTAPKSTFTFELLDDEEAAEYSFIVFNDATPVIIGDAYTDVKIQSRAEEKVKSMHALEEEEEITDYRMDIKVDINPQAQVNIVMDPIGGDCIHANGAGQMHMTYNSTDEDLRLIGTYTLDKGDYNFTLQDILIKNFTIRQGSSITFTGDPYAAKLDINAIYSVNANLSDLDESFLQDKELNRTNVPVYAVMKVTGNMLQPDIAFDLEFPTLQQDVYRKVRSIVSTDDMMNRQIIYLLALNRFYTPEYMASTTKGNELFSVASATISSQLSSMLGKLSDNWSIAPNLRSDRGDFSDVEVDLTLSSSLLNNRLLFNGNFGYRDKSLNQNQFIGDFDIEYLLNRGGNLRLKAYNRYNDQNYYLRTAQTTQGVGIIIRRDFDNIFSFLHRKKSSNSQ